MSCIKCVFFHINTYSILVLLVWSRVAYSTADETDFWQISVSNSIIHDHNLFRLSSNHDTPGLLSSDASRSDTINRASISGLLNLQLSRQFFVLKAQIDSNQYFRNSKLDHISTDSLALWRWNAGKYFSGDIGYNYRIYQSSFTNNAILGKDLISEHTSFAIGQFAWDPNWRVRGGINWTESQHSVEERNTLDRKTSGFLVGFDYISPSNNRIGLEYQLAETDLPNLESNPLTLEDNHYLQQNLMVLLNWQIFQKTQLEGNFGYTTNAFRKFSARDFSGLTGKLSVIWDTTAKTALNLSLWRQLITAADITANYLTSKGVSIAPAWKITEKIKLSGNLIWENRVYAGDPGLVSGSLVREDDVLSGQIGLSYSPIRNADIELQYRSEKRTSNLLGADYRYSSFFASVMFKF